MPEVTLHGRAAIDARIVTAVPVVPVLPGIEAVLLAEFTYADAYLTEPGAAQADLSPALHDVRLRLDEAGAGSLGESGSLGFDLTAPVPSSDAAPAYPYGVEAGAQEDLEGVVQISWTPIGVAGDLSTDLGRQGAEDDEARLTMTLEVEFDAADGPAPDFAEYSFADLFQVVIVSEELLERGGALSPDLFGVRVKGVDAITTGAGIAVTMDMLAVSPLGGFDPSLTLNPAGEGPLSGILQADAYTAACTVSGPILAGTNVVEVFVSDEADGLPDTAIFLAPLDEPAPNAPPVAAETC